MKPYTAQDFIRSLNNATFEANTAAAKAQYPQVMQYALVTVQSEGTGGGPMDTQISTRGNVYELGIALAQAALQVMSIQAEESNNVKCAVLHLQKALEFVTSSPTVVVSHSVRMDGGQNPT